MGRIHFLLLPLLILGATQAALADLFPREAAIRERPVPGGMFKTAPLKVRAYVPGLGAIKAELRTRESSSVSPIVTSDFEAVSDPLKVALLQGRVKMPGGEEPIAASIYEINAIPTLIMSFVARGRNGMADHYEIAVPIQKQILSSRAKVSKLSRFSFQEHLCGLTEVGRTQSELSSIHQAPPAKKRNLVLELNLDGDGSWYQRYGKASNAKMLSLVNQAEAIFLRDLGISFSIARQNVFTTKQFGTVNAENKLSSYRNFTITKKYFRNADVHHLFSGQGFDGSVLGIAYVNTACVSPDRAFSIQATPSYKPIYNGKPSNITITRTKAPQALIFAHEIAHNLGAGHDPGHSIMSPSISSSTPKMFSDYSKNQMRTFVQQFGTCLRAGI